MTVQGVSSARYPFNAGNPATIVADFAEFRQWVIEPKTTHNGAPFAYNELTTALLGPGGGLPNGATFNCAVRDLVITAKNIVPFGGVRMHGCPGSIVDNVAIQNVGCGLLVNCCFGGSYSVHALTQCYGVVAWDDVNGNNFEVYAARQEGVSGPVQAGYRMPFMSALNGQLVPVHGLASNAHYSRSHGLIVGSLSTTSNTNVFDYVGERFEGGLFTLYAYSLHFRKFYVESSAGVMLAAIAGARSNIKIETYHAYLSGGGAYWDTGFVENVDVTVNGIAFAGAWGQFKIDNQSSLMVRGRTLEAFGPPVPQFNVTHERSGIWSALTLAGAWAASGGLDVVPAFRRQSEWVVLTGEVISGAAGTTIATVPAGYRPIQRVPFRDFYVTASGEIVARANGPIVLTGARWEPSL